VVSEQGEYREVAVPSRDAARVLHLHLFKFKHAQDEAQVPRIRALRARELDELIEVVLLGYHHLGVSVDK